MATAKKTAEPGKKPAGAPTEGLKVMTRFGTFWRGGRQWSTEAATVSLADLTETQAEQIRAEGESGGRLIVEDVEIPAAAAKA